MAKYESKITVGKGKFGEPLSIGRGQNIPQTPVLPPIPKTPEEDVNLRFESFNAMALAVYHRDMGNAGDDPFLQTIAQHGYILNYAKINAWQKNLENKFFLIRNDDNLDIDERKLLQMRIIERSGDPMNIPTIPREREVSPIQAAIRKSLGLDETSIEPTQITEIPEELKPIETASELLGQIQTMKRVKPQQEMIKKQLPKIQQRLVDEINTLAGYEKFTEEVPLVGEFGRVHWAKKTERITRWPKEAISVQDITKLGDLTEEEMATVRATLALGDPAILKQLIADIKSLK